MVKSYKIIYKQITLYNIEYYVGVILDEESRVAVYTTKALSEISIKQRLQNKIRWLEYQERKNKGETSWE
jgi:hypothetical protein